MTTLVTNADFRAVKTGEALEVRTSRPAKTSVAGESGGLYKFVDGVLEAATATDTDVYVAFNLPGEKKTFAIGDSVNVSQNGIFRTKIKSGETIVTGDKIMVDTADSTQVVKFVAGASNVVLATVTQVIDGVAIYEKTPR